MKKKTILFFAAIFLLAVQQKTFAQSSVAGTYRCWMFNVGGSGGHCATGSPPLVLYDDGTYRLSGETGTYAVDGDQITLSESKIRGPGRLDENRITFEYDYQGLHHSVTYLRQGEAEAKPESSDSSEGRLVDVDVTLNFSEDNGTLGWVNSAILVPEPNPDDEHWDGVAYKDGDLTLKTGFREVKTGRIYRLFLDTGTDKQEVPETLDLRKTTHSVKFKIDVP